MRKAILIALLCSSFLITPQALAKPAGHTPPPEPASPRLIMWALQWREQATAALERLNAVRAAYGFPQRQHGFETPPTVAPAHDWLRAGEHWRREARRWNDEYRRLWERMTHPTGSGAERWRPLIAFYWPDSLVAKAVWVVSRESGGNAAARNPSGAAGLFQLLPAPADWSDPAINVRCAYYHKYLPALREYGDGWRPWSACGA